MVSRLDYLEELGVDAIWLNPVMVSPMADNGYDVADPRDVNPLFGGLAANHTSSQHPWFRAALESRPGGAGQWYLHLFDAEQPDLNWDNPEIARDLATTLRFWLDRGVDGFRIDVTHAETMTPASTTTASTTSTGASGRCSTTIRTRCPSARSGCSTTPVTRYGGGAQGLARARAMAMVMLALPGAVFVYNGEGHTERGRDGCRVPMPWEGTSPPFGFSTNPDTWLPIPADWAELTVQRQIADPGSMLHFFRELIRLRRNAFGFTSSDIEWLRLDADVLEFRSGGVRCLLNTGTTPVAVGAGGC